MPEGARIWLYKRPFRVDFHECWVLLDARMSGLTSTLWIDGERVAEDFTPASGAEAIRNHRLAATLPDGRLLDVEAGYISWINVGIAAIGDVHVMVHALHGPPVEAR